MEDINIEQTITPEYKRQLINEIGIRYRTSVPTHTPRKPTEVWIVDDGGTYYIYAWAGGAWKKVQIS